MSRTSTLLRTLAQIETIAKASRVTNEIES